MNAIGLYHFISEWRVTFTIELLSDFDLTIRKWIDQNLTECVEGTDYRVMYAHRVVTFLKEEDALMCYMAFL